MIHITVSVLFLLMLLAVLGYGGIATPFAGLAQLLFLVFAVLFLVSAVASAVRGRPPV
ncbi:MAG TPA: DUF1328 domain-containing protein [Lacipirellulaceae bacterium]|nr:DUF1328 domain-containing protein [Lacipirellulaceae bacterium]HMP05612.1 DUF1328 domain-containing protein [Lacipirellulaceae bacterium]